MRSQTGKNRRGPDTVAVFAVSIALTERGVRT
jgi:hypothetical protein